MKTGFCAEKIKNCFDIQEEPTYLEEQWETSPEQLYQFCRAALAEMNEDDRHKL